MTPQTPASEGWTAWEGGECPTSDRVDVRFANGEEWHDYAAHMVAVFFRYDRFAGRPENNVVAYRRAAA